MLPICSPNTYNKWHNMPLNVPLVYQHSNSDSTQQLQYYSMCVCYDQSGSNATYVTFVVVGGDINYVLCLHSSH